MAEMLEVVPSGIALDEAPGHAEAGTIIGGQKKGLFGGSGPPLVNGAVMLPKLAHIRPPEWPVGPRLALRVRNEMSQVRFDIFLHGGSRPLELVQTLEFVGN